MATSSTTADAPNPLIVYLASMPDQSVRARVWTKTAAEAFGNDTDEKLTIQEIQQRLTEHTEGQDPIICTSLPRHVLSNSTDEAFQLTSETWFPTDSKTTSFCSPFLGQKGAINELGVLGEDAWITVIEGKIRVGVIKPGGDPSTWAAKPVKKGRLLILSKDHQAAVFLDEDSIVLFGHVEPGENE